MYKHFSGNVNLSVFKSWTPVVGYGYDKWFYIGRDSGNLFFLDFNYHNVFSILNIRICKKAILKYFRYTLLYVSSRYFALNLLNQSCVDQRYDHYCSGEWCCPRASWFKTVFVFCTNKLQFIKYYSCLNNCILFDTLLWWKRWLMSFLRFLWFYFLY